MKIRTDCFWYRPLRDMGACIDWCEIAGMDECSCENCKWYISKHKADNLIYTILQIWVD